MSRWVFFFCPPQSELFHNENNALSFALVSIWWLYRSTFLFIFCIQSRVLEDDKALEGLGGVVCMSRSSPSSAECYERLAGRGDDEDEESGPVTSHRSESVLLVDTKACSNFKKSAAVHITGGEAWQQSQLKPPTFGPSAQGVIRLLRCQRGEGRDTPPPRSPPPALCFAQNTSWSQDWLETRVGVIPHGTRRMTLLWSQEEKVIRNRFQTHPGQLCTSRFSELLWASVGTANPKSTGHSRSGNLISEWSMRNVHLDASSKKCVSTAGNFQERTSRHGSTSQWESVDQGPTPGLSSDVSGITFTPRTMQAGARRVE